MEIVFRNIIIFLASVLGFIVILLGIKNIDFKKNKKHNLFIASILIFLNLSNCVSSQTENSEKSFLKIKQSDKIKELNKNTEWQNLKTLWHKIDEFEPVEYDNSKIKSYISYNFESDTINQNKYLNELDLYIENIKKTDLLSDTEIEFLKTVFTERINFLLNSNAYLLVSHIAPPKIKTDRLEYFNNLELKIDTLNNLQNKGLISEDDFTKSVDNIYQEVHEIALVTQLNNIAEDNYFGFSDYDTTSTVENNLLQFENYINSLKMNENVKNEIRDKIRITKEKMIETEDNYLSFKELIEDLLLIDYTFPAEIDELKLLWKKIDSIEPVFDKETKEMTYNFTGDSIFFVREDLKTELYNIINEFKASNSLTEIELDVLRMLIFNRIEAVQGPNLYTRSFSTVNNTLDQAHNLEFQIDTLNQLIDKNLISTEQYNSALFNIFDLSDEIIFKIIFTMNFYYLDNEYNSEANVISEKYLEILDNYYNEIKSNIKKDDSRYNQIDDKYLKTKDKIKEIEKILPKIHRLIEYFEE